MVQKNNCSEKRIKLTSKVRRYLKKETLDLILHRLQVKLSVVCKNKRIRIANRNGFKVNKLLEYNKNSYLNKLRNGENEQMYNLPIANNIQS